MSDYEFRCPDCKKVNCIHSTGDIPNFEASVECINCGRISIVQDIYTTLEVNITPTKKVPSQLQRLNKEEEQKS